MTILRPADSYLLDPPVRTIPKHIPRGGRTRDPVLDHDLLSKAEQQGSIGEGRWSRGTLRDRDSCTPAPQPATSTPK
ncbi:hypothetical protein BDV06DRAFT_200985 [Aspergillus oleicola]